MDSVIECASCGFSNWPGETVCGRCAAPLAFIEEVAGEGRAPTGRGTNRCSFCGTEFEGPYCTLCRKPVYTLAPPAEEPGRTSLTALFMPTRRKLVVAAVVVAVTAAAVLVSRRQVGGGPDRAYAEAIQKAFDFRAPVAVSFAERGEELAPGVEVLRELGLVEYRLGALTLRRVRVDQVVWTEDYSLEERGTIVPNVKPVKLAVVTLTDAGLRASAGWGTYRPEVGAQSPYGDARGWRVPVGAREFVGVREAQPASQGATGLMEVVFAWRWRPDELGRHFDVSGKEFRRLPAAAQSSALARDFNDSGEEYTGRALVRYDNGAWIVQDLKFNGRGSARR